MDYPQNSSLVLFGSDKKTKSPGSGKSGVSAIFMHGGSAIGRWPNLW